MKYLLGTGYHCNAGDKGNAKTAGLSAPEFFPIWWENTIFCGAKRIVVLATGNGPRPKTMMGQIGRWIDLDGDLGHTHDLNTGQKPYHWCGWSIALVTLALIAYADECDYVFKESDVLAFGPWVERMYAEIGDYGMVFGKARCMPAVQSVLLCKHEFIPQFVRIYLGTGSEQEKRNEGELKFARMEKEHPHLFGRFSFGVDRDRPLPYNDEVWYAQHLTEAELAELKRRGLIENNV
jgi:hypothetical protein